ncbi:MAG: hypothetical protein H7Y03_09110 [Chitinophagaceae bacterium]|nr:hypothetical protein [Chitinophagaceae bacterium]
MFQIKLFSGSDLTQVQDEINSWLSAHKDIAVSHSNINTIASGAAERSTYTFYMLYTTTEARIEELKELAAEVRPESSVEVTDINPDVLQPSN